MAHQAIPKGDLKEEATASHLYLNKGKGFKDLLSKDGWLVVTRFLFQR